MSRPPLPLILASASPRRSELLNQAGIRCQVLPSRVRERFGKGSPQAQAMRLALAKAGEVAARLRCRGYRRALVLGADTIVAKGGRLLGKPSSPKAAAAMLRLLSGSSHDVVTGLALVPLEGEPWVAHERTRVWFRKLEAEEIGDYVRGGEPMDKAGAYGIQGRAAVFVKKISGDYFNVVGLPLARLAQGLKTFN